MKSTRLARIIDSFSALSVVVVGEAILDIYLRGATQRLCREAPVPVVDLSGRDFCAGGAANTAVNFARLGAAVRLLSVVGDDLQGAILRRCLIDGGVDISGLVVDGARETMAKHRVIADSQLLVRFDVGSRERPDGEVEGRLIGQLKEAFADADAIAVSDYGYGVVSPAVIRTLRELQQSHPRVLVVDSKHLRSYRQVGVTAVKPNYAEAVALLGLRPAEGAEDRAQQVVRHGQRVLELTGANLAMVTLVSDGAVAFERGRAPYRTYARPASHARAAGAGDTFVAALTAALAAGAHTAAACELASAAAAIVVGREGTTTCSQHELREHFSLSDKLIEERERLIARVALYRQQGRRVVFTNGCFDILHGGHITYLNRAKALGDVLVIGLNSDGSIKRLKGPARPINPLPERAQVLSALSCVDHIVPFDEDTPEELIRAVRPDVFVKGGDYTRARLPEADTVEKLGGRVEILPYVANRSTTGIIERIRVAYGGEAADDGDVREGA